MPASTDLLKKVSRRWVGQIGAAGVSDASTATIPLSSTTNLPTTTAVVAVIDRVDANGVATPNLEETVIGVVSGSNLATSTRGVEGTAQAHNAGAVVEVLITAKGWNDIIDMLLVGHTQLGAHSASSIVATNLAASSVLAGNLAASSVLAGNLAASSVSTGNLDFSISASTDGWTSSSDTWTYASSTTFTISGVDRTTTFTKGTRLKLTQTTAKYFVVVSSSFSTNTTVTVTGGTDYTIANAAITNPYYSYQANPQGYPSRFAYTPSYTGFSADPSSVTASFHVTGTICHYFINEGGNGTSNSTSKSISLPVTSKSGGTPVLVISSVVDNGTQAYGKHVIGSNATVTASYPAVATANWTASGGCRLFESGGFLMYEI